MIEKIESLIKEYLKSGNKTLLSVARTTKAELLANQKAVSSKSDVDVIKSCKKKLEEEIEAFISNESKVKELSEQKDWLEQFLPKMTTLEDIEDYWKGKELNIETGDKIHYNMGEIMKDLKSHFGDALDGKIASEFARKYISSL